MRPARLIATALLLILPLLLVPPTAAAATDGGTTAAGDWPHRVSGSVTWEDDRLMPDDGDPGFTIVLCSDACITDLGSYPWWDPARIAGEHFNVNPGGGTAYELGSPTGTFVAALRFNSGFSEGYEGGYLQQQLDDTWRLVPDFPSGTPFSVGADLVQDFHVVTVGPATEPTTEPSTEPEQSEPEPPRKPRIGTVVLPWFVVLNDRFYGGMRFAVRRAKPGVTVRVQFVGCGGKVVASRTVRGKRGRHSISMAPSPRKLGPDYAIRIRLTQRGHQTRTEKWNGSTRAWPGSRRQFRC